MKPDIHPPYHQGSIVCGTCGTEWVVGSTREGLRVNICANCHPFYTGEQRVLVDTEGQVDRFMKKLAATQQKQETARKRREERVKPQKKKSLLEEIYGDERAAEGDSAPATATPAEAPASSEQPADNN